MKELIDPKTQKPFFALVGIKLLILPSPDIYPAGNLIGAVILHHAVSAALQAEDASLLETGSVAGPLNSAQMLFSVRSAAPALAVLDAVLKKTHLRELATIFAFHPGEQAFLPVGPDNAMIGCHFTIEAMLAQRALDGANIDSHQKHMCAIVALIKSHTAPQEPPPIFE